MAGVELADCRNSSYELLLGHDVTLCCAAPYGLTELCPAIGSGAAPKGHGGPKVCALADQGAMVALRGRGAESGGLTHRP